MTKKIDNPETMWVNAARFFAALAVVTVHCAYQNSITTDKGFSVWLSGGLLDSFSRWCVPVFVIISGALLLKPKSKISIMSFYSKRLTKFLIPFTFWIIFYLLIRFRSDYQAGLPLQPTKYIQAILEGKVFSHLWYIFMLFGLYLFTPFCQKLLDVLDKKETFILICILWFLTILNDWIINNSKSNIFILWFMNYLGYYIMGYYLRYFAKIPKLPLLWLSCFFISSMLVLYIRYNTFYLTRNDPLTGSGYTSPYVILQSLSITCFFMSISYKNQTLCIIFKSMAPLALGIYLAHPFFIYIFNMIARNYSFNAWINVILMTTTVFISTLIFVMMCKKLPLLNKIV